MVPGVDADLADRDNPTTRNRVAESAKRVMTDDNQDEEWMEAVCQGDRHAFQTLVNNYHQAISHYAYRLLGNRSDAEDVTQETFLRLWINAASWRPDKAKLTTWLHRIAHNLSIDFLRKQGRLQSESDSNSTLEEVTDRQQGDNCETTEYSNTEDGKLLRLQQSLGNLPEAQRSAIMLCTFSGFSNQEAADIMGVSVKALESLLARARRGLRTSLARQTNDETDIPKENGAGTE